MNKNIGIVMGTIVIAGIGYLSFFGDKVENIDVVNTNSEVQSEVTNNMPVPGSNVPETVVETVSPGSYIAYGPEKIAMAATGDVVIFFHASWCPSCRGLNSDIEKNMSAIPAGVTILKADYDKETEMKKKYGVTTQHTLVQVDKDGNMIKKWSGGGTLAYLISQIM